MRNCKSPDTLASTKRDLAHYKERVRSRHNIEKMRLEIM